MGNTPAYQFSPITQATFDMNKYEGMWYKVFDSSSNTGCNSMIVFCFVTGTTLNMTTYCIVDSKLARHEQAYATTPNRYDPSKLVVKKEGILGSTSNYWIYYTDYINFAIVGDGKLNKTTNGSNYFVLARKSKLTPELEQRIQNEIVKHAI